MKILHTVGFNAGQGLGLQVCGLRPKKQRRHSDAEREHFSLEDGFHGFPFAVRGRFASD
jgi:hypothetical protein